MLSLIASFSDMSLGFEGRCELTQMDVQCSDVVSQILADHQNEI